MPSTKIGWNALSASSERCAYVFLFSHVSQYGLRGGGCTISFLMDAIPMPRADSD